jgi:lysylphosphatidylglycerol synthetase-like protein (DUF2156 family)
MNIWDKFWRDSNGDVTIMQFPNIYLATWIVLKLLMIPIKTGFWHDVMWWFASIMLLVWAILELVAGVNYFRRVLGLIVAVPTVLSIVRAVL